MDPNHEKPVLIHVEDAEKEEEEEMVEPVSPTGQYYNSSALSVCIIAVFESETPIDDISNSLAMSMLNNVFVPISPRFSSIMVKDDHGERQWKKVNIKLEEHVKIPTFPSGLSTESYDEILQDYLTQMALEQLPQSRPLWEVHLFRYPTSNAAGAIIFKIHHALGDGYSLMGALFTCLQRADDPSLPLTFPSSRPEYKQSGQKGNKSVLGYLSGFLNTATDFTWSLLRSSVLEDHVSPIRSGKEGLEFKPLVISTVTFCLDKIKHIKHKLGGTVNDVIIGIVFYGLRLYMESVSKGSSNARSTALVLLNTRVIGSYSYKTVEEMMKPDTKSPWGNRFGYLHVSIPESVDANKEDPLKFVSEVKNIIKKKKTSLSVYLTGQLLELMRKYKSSEKTSQFIYGALANASTAITSLLGPTEKMSLANHPIKGFYFMVVNVPLDTVITMVSYMGKVRVGIGAQKEVINQKLFNKSLELAFERIFEAAMASSSSSSY